MTEIYLVTYVEKKIGEKGHLQKHVDIVHAGKREYVCEHCQKTFSISSNLEKHLKSHKTEIAN